MKDVSPRGAGGKSKRREAPSHNRRSCPVVRGGSAVSSGDGRNWHQDQDGEQVPSVFRHLFLPSPHLHLAPTRLPGPGDPLAASGMVQKRHPVACPPFLNNFVPCSLPPAGSFQGSSLRLGHQQLLPLGPRVTFLCRWHWLSGCGPVPVPGRCGRSCRPHSRAGLLRHVPRGRSGSVLGQGPSSRWQTSHCVPWGQGLLVPLEPCFYKTLIPFRS